MSKSRPILFSGLMVRAILDGCKTQTRRAVKPQPPEHIDELHGGQLSKRAPYDIEDEEQLVCGWGFQDDLGGFYKFPYGSIGSRLWVRETFAIHRDEMCDPKTEDDELIFYRADEGCFHRMPSPYPPMEADYNPLKEIASDLHPNWRPSIFMPRWASRITLEITGVRVERLQGISEADAKAEGCCERTYREGRGHESAKLAFRQLWQSINGPDSWASNPWVWVIEFKRVD